MEKNNSMRNELGIYHLFGENEEAKRKFYNWCENNEELCEYDLEQIAIDLEMPVLDNMSKYIHFHLGSILDWLESIGYYIGIPLRGKFKYVTVVHFNYKGNVNQRPIYSNRGVKLRSRAIELGIIKSIEHYNKSKNENN